MAKRPLPPDIFKKVPTPVLCKMVNGQPRPFPCEFQILKMYILGKGDEVVSIITPGTATVKLPKSKAVEITQSFGTESYRYHVSLDFIRINPPCFGPKPLPIAGIETGFYEVGTSTVNYPVAPTDKITVVKKVNVSPKLPSPNTRPQRVSFTLQLNYTLGSGATILSPVQYLQIRNPITSAQFPPAINQSRDRAEAWIEFHASVDMTS